MERIRKERTGTTPGNRKPRVAFLLACVLASLCFTPLPSLAWEQDEHMEINRIAYEKFISLYSASEKFRLSPIDTGMRYPGPYTTSASLFASGNTADAVVTAAGLAIPALGAAKSAAETLGYSADFSDYTVESQFHTLRGWVTHGGYSADEPEMYASVRHFYDPTNTDGHPELTDQENLHGFYDYAVSALAWGFTHPDNAFSFMKGLEYYKKAMEIPEDGKPPAAIPASGGDGSFRDLAFTPEHSEHARRFYLGKAFRALGESMHMISDMAMPAHTRNDSHPYFESIETPLRPEMITASSAYSAEPVDLSRTPMQNFITLAEYTNAHFYTDDTIYIPEKGVTPRNGEKNYESPRLSDLKPVKDGNRVTYYQLFSEWPHSVPMIVEQVLYLGAFHKLLQTVSSFSVPPELGPYYCDKLVPLAIKASYRMMYEFLPTLRLSITGTIEELEEEESRLGFTHKVLLSSAMVHERENDPAWVEARLSIDYSGPGELYRQRKANKEKIADLIYEDGILAGIRTSEKGEEFSSIIGPIVMYAVPENTKAVAPRGFPEELAFERFMIQDGDSLSVTIEAGGRKITGESWVYKEEGAEVVIQPPRIMLYELLEGAQSVEHTFEAVARPEGDYRFVWDFGDGSPGVETAGKASRVKHTYTGVGDYSARVTLTDVNAVRLSSDGVLVRLMEDQGWEGTWTASWDESSTISDLFAPPSGYNPYFTSTTEKPREPAPRYTHSITESLRITPWKKDEYDYKAVWRKDTTIAENGQYGYEEIDYVCEERISEDSLKTYLVLWAHYDDDPSDLYGSYFILQHEGPGSVRIYSPSGTHRETLLKKR